MMKEEKKYLEYIKTGSLLLVPILIIWILSLLLTNNETEEKQDPKATAFAQKQTVQEAEKDKLEKEIETILKKNNLSLDQTADEIFDELFEKWNASEKDQVAIEKMLDELNEKIEKSPLKDQLKINFLEEGPWVEQKLLDYKEKNNHPLDVSLENCVEQNLEKLGPCFMSHIPLWEKELKKNYDILTKKFSGDAQKNFIKSQELWYENLMAQQKLAESLIDKKATQEVIARKKIEILLDILQQIKDRCLILEQMINE